MTHTRHTDRPTDTHTETQEQADVHPHADPGQSCVLLRVDTAVTRTTGHLGAPPSPQAGLPASEPQVCTLVRSWEKGRGREAHWCYPPDSRFCAWGRSLRTNAEPSQLKYTCSPNQPHGKLKGFTLSPRKNHSESTSQSQSLSEIKIGSKKRLPVGGLGRGWASKEKSSHGTSTGSKQIADRPWQNQTGSDRTRLGTDRCQTAQIEPRQPDGT